jgi:hypothetical protein
MVWLIEPGFSSGGQEVRMAEVIVPVFPCTDDSGGETTVPAGSRIVLRFGWVVKTKGLVQAYLQAQTTTISINGAAPIDVSDSYSPIEEHPDGGFVSRVRYDTGVTLSAGESLQADGTVVVSNPVVDLTDETTGRPALFKPGEDNSFSCRITASA